MKPAEKDEYLDQLQEYDPTPWTEQDALELTRVLAQAPLKRALSRVLSVTTEQSKTLVGLDMRNEPESNIRAAAIQGHIRGISSALEALVDLAGVQETEEQDDNA